MKTTYFYNKIKDFITKNIKVITLTLPAIIYFIVMLLCLSNRIMNEFNQSGAAEYGCSIYLYFRIKL